MLIIAALNLPSTAVFESDDSDLPNQDTQKSNSQSVQSLIRNDPEEIEQKPELPFDFDAEQSESPAPPPISSNSSSRPRTPKPAKSIVDERVHNSSSDRREQSGISSIAPSVSQSKCASGFASPEGRSWDPSRALEILNNQLRTTSYLGSLSRMSGEDDDVKLERERMDSNNSKQLGRSRSQSSLSFGTMSGILAPGRREREPSVPHPPMPSQNNEFVKLDFHLDILRSSNRGLFNALENAHATRQIPDYKCVGLIGMDTDVLPQTTKDDISEMLMKEENCHAVYVSDSEREGHYDQYCKEFLWPTFHCQIPDIPTSKAYEEHSWGDYVSVNQAIADKIVEVYEQGDVVWVHDYHLMLVPHMVRQKLPQAAIGFFMHVAFPSSEVFRGLAYRAELLTGVLAANSVAFHIPEYAQHFKMSLARILAVDITGPGVIETSDHDAFVTTCPLGIDVALLDQSLDVGNPNSAVQQHRRVIRNRWPTQRLIASRDKVDPVRGIPQKLRAFNQFLSENPQWASKVVLVQICNSGPHVFQSSGVESLVDQINSTYGDISSGVQPVVLLKQDVRFEQYLALLSEADGFCVSCLRDGMNLTCHEYIYCNDKSRMGPLILSEFTGSASVLGENSLLINPWNQAQLADAFRQCVEMPRWEREKRWKSLRECITSHPAALWATSLVKHISQAWEDEMSRECSKPDFADLETLYHSVRDDEHRLFLLELEPASTEEARKMLDKETEIMVKRKYDEHRTSNPELNTRGPYYTSRLPIIIRDLCSDPRNIVYITSAESPDHMERMYRSLPGLGLIAEFGKYVRPKDSDSESWMVLPSDQETDWQSKMEPWLRLLRERGLANDIIMNNSSIIVELNTSMDYSGGIRDLSTIGEYISLINDHYAREVGIRTKLEGNILTLYRSNLGLTRKRAFETVLDEHKDKKIGLLMLANQPYATEADDVVYRWAESVKTSGWARELITTVVGKHPSHAHCMVEGTNAMLNLLQTMRTKEPLKQPKSFRRTSIADDVST